MLKHEVYMTFGWSDTLEPRRWARAACRGCVWAGPVRQSDEVARIDGKQHRLDTAAEDDANRKAKR
jgi:hypothetical protein